MKTPSAARHARHHSPRLALWLALAALAPAGLAQAQSAADMDEGDLGGMEAGMQADADRAAEGRATNAAVKGQLDAGAAMLGSIVQAATSWKDLTESYKALDPSDGGCEPDYNPAGAPGVPSACAESGACQACYEKAVREIDFYRFSLDKGRCLASSTIDFAKKAMAFGDTASGSFGVGGMAWSLKARPEVEKAVAKLRKTYAGKYGEWIAGLEKSLQTLGRCEEEHFGERDWYGRFGFLYYSFMADRYRSPD